MQDFFMMVMSGLGATIGAPLAGIVVNNFVFNREPELSQLNGWQTSWFIFAAYALLVALSVYLFLPASMAQMKKDSPEPYA